MAFTKRPHPSKRKATADAFAGAVASLVALWVFYPVDVWKTSVQASVQLDHKKSWTRLFAGMKLKTLHTASSSFCYFFLYSWIFSWHRRRQEFSKRQGNIAVSTRLVLSAVAAMINTCVTLPLDVLASRNQVSCKDPDTTEEGWQSCTVEDADSDREGLSDGGKKSDETHRLDKKVYASDENEERADRVIERTSMSFLMEDYRPMWKGLIPSLLLGSNPSIHFTVFDVIKSQVLKHRSGQLSHNLNMAEAFLLGLVAKFVATIATYPLIRAKVMIMVSSQPSTQLSPVTELFNCLSDEYRKHRIQGLYRGCRLQLFHTLLKSALLMMVRERIALTTDRILKSTETSG